MGWTLNGSLRMSDQTVDWNGDEIRIALLLSTYAFNVAHATWADVKASEFVSSNANYVTFNSAGGGVLLGGKSISNDTSAGNRTIYRAAALSIPGLDSSGVKTVGSVAVLAANNVTKDDSIVIATVDFSTIHTANGGQLDINWGGAGNDEVLADILPN